MDGFFNAFKSSGLVKVVQDVAEDALHVNRDGKGSVLGDPFFHICIGRVVSRLLRFLFFDGVGV